MTLKDAILEELKKRLQEYMNLKELENSGFSNIQRILDVVGRPWPGNQINGLLTKADAMDLLAQYFLEWSELQQAFLSGKRPEKEPVHYSFF